MPSLGLTATHFRTGFYGERVAQIENAIFAACGQEESDEFLRRAAALEPGELYFLVVRRNRPVVFLEDVNETAFMPIREQLTQKLAADGWLSKTFASADGIRHLKMPHLKRLAARLRVPRSGKKEDLVAKVLLSADALRAAEELFDGQVFRLTDQAMRLLSFGFDSPVSIPPRLPKLSAKSSGSWFRLRRTRVALPFCFRPEHPASCGFADFAIWAAFAPQEARGWFDEALMNAFEYSWRSLLPWVPAVGARMTPPEFARLEPAHRTLHREFRGWGNLFFWGAWAGLNDEPLLFKILPPAAKRAPIARHWVLPDGRTPRVYRFDEIAFQEREFLPEVDQDDDEDGDATLKRELQRANIGIQWADDCGELALLHKGFGFDREGSVTFVALDHSEWSKQHSMP
jgi:hypothetical protein